MLSSNWTSWILTDGRAEVEIAGAKRGQEQGMFGVFYREPQDAAGNGLQHEASHRGEQGPPTARSTGAL
jgi:hypothetical protein